MKNFDWKKVLPYVAILMIFLIASVIYFKPAMEGKVLNSADAISSHCASQECRDYREISGEDVWWTDSMFGGMPTYQIGGGGRFLADNITRPIRMVLYYGTTNVAFLMFFYLLTFFLLLRSLKVDKWVAVAGAFAMAMSSYFFIIIAASHMTKCYTIAWMMLVVAGFMLIYQKQRLWGAVLTSFFTYFAFYAHPQMGYYICMMLGIFVCAEIAIAVRDKSWKDFGISTAVFAGAFALGMMTGGANFFTNSEYSKETMRGGHSDIQRERDEVKPAKGLDIDYATAWSYGKAETLTLLIPNYMGGCSGYNLGEGSSLEQDLKKMGVPGKQARSFCQGAPTYWGEKAFTSGPVYVGAIICFLFILGLLIVPGPYKWALLIATLFSITLAWGRNLMGWTELFFNYFPMYNKFRAVESILVVAEITMPLLAFLGVKELMSNESLTEKAKRNAILIAGGLTSAICLYVLLFSSGFDVSSSYDAQWKGQVGERIYDAILSQRHAMITADAWRSLVFILIGMSIVFAYTKIQSKQKNLYLALALTVVIVADMWPVNKRFCNDSVFISPKQKDVALRMQPYEKDLLDRDKSNYRVLNLTVNTFNDSRTSLYFKSTGGYHAAKLRRYQDMIDEHISKFHMPVLNMLNTKYIITKGRDGQPIAQLNPDVFGSCWFVDDLVPVDNANAESDALVSIDLRHQAVYDQTYAQNEHILEKPEFSTLMAFAEDKIELTNYMPHHLCYHAEVERPKTAVFSEIYYPYGWKATVDGVPTEIFRVNYMLRAITVPAGVHDIEFVFDPDSVRIGNIMSMCSLSVMILLLIGGCAYEFKKRKSITAKNA